MMDTSSTGMTALSCNDTFLHTSYVPSNRAEQSPRINHMIYWIGKRYYTSNNSSG